MAVGLDDVKRIHLIGVGGCSMSGIAQILQKQGHVVTGSDRERSQFTDRLEELGIPVSIPQKGEQVEGAELVIYSAAIKPDNPERALAYINEEAKLDATVHVGGFVDLLGGGVKVGDGDLFITEACEYVRSFLTLVPTVALVNNIDNDHLDCYKDQQEIIETFARFCALVPPEGKIIVCRDDEKVQRLLPLLDRTPLTYGLAEGDWHADAVEFDSLGCASFDLVHEGNTLGRITLHVPGTHNIINALAACAVASVFGVGFDSMARALDRFRNTKRRFEFMGERNGVRVFHDYGHHPNEIAATLEAASRVPHKAIYCVFQCNSYTRARTLFCENVTCFANADKVLVPDIYPGREVDTGIVHARDMVKGINAATDNALYIPTFEEIRAWLDENARPGDLVITVGSGNVYAQTRKLL